MSRRAQHPFRLYRRKGSPFWWADFLAAGRRYRVSTGESERDAAQSRAVVLWAEAKARTGDRSGIAALEQPIRQLAARLHAEAQQRGRAKSYARDLEVDLRLHILSRWTSIEQITTVAWEQAMVDLHVEGHSWRSVQRIGKHVRHLLRFAVRVGALASEPVIHSPPRADIEGEQAERRALTEDERDRLLAYLARRRLWRTWRCYVVMFYVALRRSTVARMTPRWVNWKTHTLTVPPLGTRSRKRTVLWLHPKARKAIRAEMDANPVTDPSAPIFGSFDHKGVFWRAIDALKIDRHGLTPNHVARHTAATLMGDARAGALELKAAGGWSTLETADRYTHSSVEASKRAFERLR